MPFVKAQCENCQGVLEVDSSQKAAICPYCGTPYVVQDAINNYHTHIEHLHADVVNVNDDRSAKARLEAAEVFLKLGKYEDALHTFEEASKLAPQDYRVWWGQIRAITRNFTIPLTRKSKLDKIQSLFDTTMAFIPEDQKTTLHNTFDSYYSYHRNQNDQARSVLQSKIDQCNRQLADINKQSEELRAKHYNNMHRLMDYHQGLFSTVLIIGVILFLIKKNNLILVGLVVFTAIYIFHDFILCPVINSIRNAERKATQSKSERLAHEKNSVASSKINAESQLRNL